MALHEDINHLTLLINRSPQILIAAINFQVGDYWTSRKRVPAGHAQRIRDCGGPWRKPMDDALPTVDAQDWQGNDQGYGGDAARDEP
jgi:hypothetical protein